MHTRCDVDIYADVEILELRIYEWIDSHSTDTGLERSGGHRNSTGHFERRLQTIRCSNLRVLQQLAVAIRKEKVQRCLGNRDLEVVSIEILKLIQANSAGCTCRLSRSGAGSAGSARATAGGRRC